VLKWVETVEAEKKILKALSAAAAFLDGSMLALDEKDDDSLADGVWHVAAELEYALFLFSIVVQDEIDKSKWKLRPKLAKAEAGLMLVTVRGLLDKAEECMGEGQLLDAFRRTYIARGCVLKIQKDLDRKKREAFRRKK